MVAVGFYGERLDVGIGSYAGWDAFGPERMITRSEGNVLYEIDGRNALELYQELLGPLGYALPASGLLFPRKVRANVTGTGVVRTILGVNAGDGSVTFAGDVPQDCSVSRVDRATEEGSRSRKVASEGACCCSRAPPRKRVAPTTSWGTILC